MPTYTWDYNAFKWVPTPISWPATWALWLANMWLAEAPILFLDNAIDTVVDWLPNVYNWAVDEYNAWASKRALNNYINNEWKRWREQIQKRQAGESQWMPATRLQTIPTNSTSEKVQQFIAENNAILWRAEQDRNAEAKNKIVDALSAMVRNGWLTKNAQTAKKLIDLYNRI